MSSQLSGHAPWGLVGCSEAGQSARAALDAMVGAECPLCGDLMIRSITQPFLATHEAAEEALSWAIPV
jgi:hypothetical protein